MLELVAKARRSESDDAAIAERLRGLAARGSDSFTVQEHLTLVYMKRLGYSVDELLIRSWNALTGEKVAGELPRLPKRVLDRESLETVAFYEAAFHRGRQQGIFAKVPAGHAWLATVVSRISGSSFWNRGMGLFALIACAMLLIPIARQLLIGCLLGLAEASVIEYVAHLGLCHASRETTSRWRRKSFIGIFIEEINLAHRTHHFKMLTDCGYAFSGELSKQRVENYLESHARAIVAGRIADGIYPRDREEQEVARIIKEIRAANYGVDGTAMGVLAENILAIPLQLVNLLLFLHFGGVAFLVTSALVLGSFVGLSMYSHRYIHMTDEEVERASQAGTTSALGRWYSKTPVARLQARRHYRHHHESFEYSKAVNGVIMWFSTADFILRRGVQEADIKHLLKMRKEGFTNYA